MCYRQVWFFFVRVIIAREILITREASNSVPRFKVRLFVLFCVISLWRKSDTRPRRVASVSNEGKTHESGTQFAARVKSRSCLSQRRNNLDEKRKRFDILIAGASFWFRTCLQNEKKLVDLPQKIFWTNGINVIIKEYEAR